MTNFFSCQECVGHFAVIAAGLEQNLMEMASQHRHGRDRAALWLWQAHNRVNERLAAEALSDSPSTQLLEFAKVQWPPRSVCKECREVTRPHAGVKAETQWRHQTVLQQLYEQYCLEARFECWAQLTRMGSAARPPTELSATLGTYGLAAGVVLLLLLACGCVQCGHGLPSSAQKKKRDHVV